MKLKTAISWLVTAAIVIAFGTGSLQAESVRLDIDDYVSRVVNKGKVIRSAKKELELAGAVKREALASALPKLVLEGEYNRNINDLYMYVDFSSLMPGMGDQKLKVNYKNEFSLTAAVSQPVFSFQTGNALKAAKQYQKITGYAYKATVDNVKQSAKKAFYQTLLLQKVVEVNRGAEESARENFELMKKKFEFGQVSRLQLLQAESRWLSQVPKTTESEKNYQLALNNLKTLADLPSESEFEPLGDFSSLPPIPEKISLDLALQGRSDYNALLWEEKLRKSGIRSERGKILPTLDLNVAYSYSALSDEFKFERENKAFIVGLNLKFPVYLGGYARAQIRKAKIEREKTLLKIDMEKDRIGMELKNLRLRLREAVQRINAAEKGLETAKKAYEVARVTAREGLTTQLELKDTRLIYDQAKLGHLAASYDYLAAWLDWEYASGRKIK